MLLSIGEAAGLNIDGLLAAVFDGLQRFPNFSQLLALLLLENILPQNLVLFYNISEKLSALLLTMSKQKVLFEDK